MVVLGTHRNTSARLRASPRTMGRGPKLAYQSPPLFRIGTSWKASQALHAGFGISRFRKEVSRR